MNAAENLFQAIRSEMAKRQAETVPEGWLTIEQWMETSGVSMEPTRRALHAGVKVGLLEKRTFRVLVGGRPRAVFHFRPIEKRKPQPSKPQKKQPA